MGAVGAARFPDEFLVFVSGRFDPIAFPDKQDPAGFNGLAHLSESGGVGMGGGEADSAIERLVDLELDGGGLDQGLLLQGVLVSLVL